MTTKRRAKAADAARLGRFVEWAIERAEEEVETGNVQGQARDFLYALIREGKRLVGEEF